MRRALLTAVTLIALALPAPVLAQSPAPSGPPSMEMAPGVTFEALAMLPGQSDPALFRIRFQPGASVDLSGTPNASLVSIETGTLVGNTTSDLLVYSGTGTSGRTAAAKTDATLQQGDFFLVPAGVAGHVRNDTDAESSMIIASLPISGITPSGSPGPSASPNG